MPKATQDRGRPSGFWAGCVLLALACAIVTTGCSSFTSSGQNAAGVRLFDQARYHDALLDFQEATYADPTNADGYYNLAATYHRLAKVENRPSDLAQAETSYNQCLDHNPNHRDCYRGLAVLLAEQGRSAEAFRLIQGWADRSPNLADPKIELARLYDETGNRPAAKEHLLEALAVEPNNSRALAALGKIREEMGDTSQALANYQRSLWYDRSQPAVASRVVALQQSTPPPPGVWITPGTPVGPATQTQTVSTPANPLR